ncbi:MAG: hypothetical protein NE334_08775 [Lentisphaeraceae bacterium]|nr:hypothetical protein [Lentisphaeraceae bacterium]
MRYLYILLVFLALACDQRVKDSELINTEAVGLKHLYHLIEQKKDKEALSILNSLFDEDEINSPSMNVTSWFERCGVKKDFLERRTFDGFDIFYLRQKLFFSSILKENNVKSVKSAFDLVRRNILSSSSFKDKSAFPIQIWERGYGVCDRQCWVLAEMITQLGGSVKIVYLRDSQTQVSRHTICEISHMGVDYIVDPLYGKFVKKSIKSLTQKDIKKIWKEYPDIHKDFSNATVYLPLMPNDYTPRIRALCKLSNQILGESWIKFDERFDEQQQFGLNVLPWDYPVRLLASFDQYKVNVQ